MLGHAAANIMPVLASNRIGKEVAGNSSMVFQGFSFIANQYGEVVEEMDRVETGVRVHEFDLDAIDKERCNWGVFRDRRPECYGDIKKFGE